MVSLPPNRLAREVHMARTKRLPDPEPEPRRPKRASDKLLTIPEAAERLNCKPSLVSSLVFRREITQTKVGRQSHPRV